MKKRILLFFALCSVVTSASALPKVAFAIRGYSNQSLAYINLQTGVVRDSVAAIGPAANTLVVRGSKLYVVNSGGSFIGLNASIMIFNIADIINNVQPLPFTRVSIPDNKNPYDLLFVSDTKAYISYLLDSSVVVFNPSNNTLGRRIQVGLGPEGLALTNGKVYVANAYNPANFTYGTTVSVISTATDSVLRTLTVYTNPQSCGVDALGRLHVVSTGPYDNTGRVTVFNTTTDTPVGTVQLYGNVSSVVFNSAQIAYSSASRLVAYNAATLDTIRTNRNPYPVASGSLTIDGGDTLYIARTGSITLYNALTRDSLSRFTLTATAPYFSVVVYREQSTTGVADAETPAELRLGQNYPNPFNPTTNIEFALRNSGLVSLKVFDVLGREVATVVHENMQRGSYTVQFDARDLSSGIYVYRLTAGGKSISRKFTLMK
jgi:hypothetical protein